MGFFGLFLKLKPSVLQMWSWSQSCAVMPWDWLPSSLPTSPGAAAKRSKWLDRRARQRVGKQTVGLGKLKPGGGGGGGALGVGSREEPKVRKQSLTQNRPVRNESGSCVGPSSRKAGSKPRPGGRNQHGDKESLWPRCCSTWRWQNVLSQGWAPLLQEPCLADAAAVSLFKVKHI